MTQKKQSPFTVLMESEAARQKAQLAGANAHKENDKDSDKDLDKDLDKASDKDAKQDGQTHTQTGTHQLPSADKVEEMMFRLRKAAKVRINGDLPKAWKQELDEYAHQAGVGKYHLVTYAVGKLLGKV